MEQEKRIVVGHVDGHFSMMNEDGTHLHIFGDGDRCELVARSRWQSVCVRRGEYNGWYYETATGERGRLALCTQVRLGAPVEEGRAA